MKMEVRDWKLEVRKQIKKCRDGVGATGGSLGITLVALVITIIVLLILAGVTISLTIGERGIFTTAQRAAQNYKEAQERELAGLNEFENIMNSTINALGTHTEPNIKEIPVTKVEITPSTTTMQPDETLQLTAKVFPENATNTDVTWNSADKEIAVVDQNGLVTGLSQGNTTIIATSNNGVVGTYEITIEKVILYLYNNGDECSNVTGGFFSITYGYASFVDNRNSVTLKNGVGEGGNRRRMF